MRPRHLPIMASLVVSLAGTVPAAGGQSTIAEEQDRLVGVWHLIVDESTYRPGPPPVRETRTYTREGDQLQGVIRREFADGRRDHIEYIANFDRVYPVFGTADYDSLSLRRVNRDTAEAVLSHAGIVFGTARRVLSRDARTMTITFERQTQAGFSTRNVAVYEKAVP